MPTSVALGLVSQDIQCPLGLALGLVSVLVHRTFSAH